MDKDAYIKQLEEENTSADTSLQAAENMAKYGI
jgi:hypothetical protein